MQRSYLTSQATSQLNDPLKHWGIEIYSSNVIDMISESRLRLLYFVLTMSFLNSTMATVLNLAGQQVPISRLSTDSKSNGRLGISGLVILLSLRIL